MPNTSSRDLFVHYRDAFLAWSRGNGTNPPRPEMPRPGNEYVAGRHGGTTITTYETQQIYQRALRAAAEIKMFGPPPEGPGAAVTGDAAAYAEFFGRVDANGNLITARPQADGRAQYVAGRGRNDANGDGSVTGGNIDDDQFNLSGGAEIERYIRGVAAGDAVVQSMGAADPAAFLAPRVNPDAPSPSQGDRSIRDAFDGRIKITTNEWGRTVTRNATEREIHEGAEGLSLRHVTGGISFRLMHGSHRDNAVGIGSSTALPTLDGRPNIAQTDLEGAERVAELRESGGSATPPVLEGLNAVQSTDALAAADRYAAARARVEVTYNPLRNTANIGNINTAIRAFRTTMNSPTGTLVGALDALPADFPPTMREALQAEFEAQRALVSSLDRIDGINRPVALAAANNIAQRVTSTIGTTVTAIPASFDSPAERQSVIIDGLNAARSGLGNGVLTASGGTLPDPQSGTRASAVATIRSYAEAYNAYITDVISNAGATGALHGTGITPTNLHAIIGTLRDRDTALGMTPTDSVSPTELRVALTRAGVSPIPPEYLAADGAFKQEVLTGFTTLLQKREQASNFYYTDSTQTTVRLELLAAGINGSLPSEQDPFSGVRDALNARLTNDTPANINSVVNTAITERMPALLDGAAPGTEPGGEPETHDDRPSRAGSRISEEGEIVGRYASTRGNYSSHVRSIQNALVAMNVDIGTWGDGTGVDGRWGGDTDTGFESAVTTLRAVTPTPAGFGEGETPTAEQFLAAAAAYAAQRAEGSAITVGADAVTIANNEGANVQALNLSAASNGIIDFGAGRDFAAINLGELNLTPDAIKREGNDIIITVADGKTVTLRNVEGVAFTGNGANIATLNTPNLGSTRVISP